MTESFSIKHFYSTFVVYLSGQLCRLGFLRKDLTVFLDGSRYANTCIPSSYLGNAPAKQPGIPIPKNTFANVNKLEKFSFWQHVSLLNTKFDVFISF
jgi:hypothetical protein